MRGKPFIILGLIAALPLVLAVKTFFSGSEPYYWSFLLFMLIGFVAQIIDGAIGMAYGVFSNSFLLSVGVPPALASASIHTAEVFTTLASGVSHLKFGNVDKKIFRNLIIPGVIGGCLGAYVLSSAPVGYMKIIVNVYLLIIGVVIIVKAVKFMVSTKPSFKSVSLLGGLGGFLDAVGGGGWGPIVTSTLIARNHNPKLAIGSVNLAEFFVTIVESITFFIALGMIDLKIVLGLALGGLIAAPFAAYLCKKLPTRLLMALVGILLVFITLRDMGILRLL
jgi:uncharacterized membrane protein YfcA